MAKQRKPMKSTATERVKPWTWAAMRWTKMNHWRRWWAGLAMLGLTRVWTGSQRARQQTVCPGRHHSNCTAHVIAPTACAVWCPFEPFSNRVKALIQKALTTDSHQRKNSMHPWLLPYTIHHQTPGRQTTLVGTGCICTTRAMQPKIYF